MAFLFVVKWCNIFDKFNTEAAKNETSFGKYETERFRKERFNIHLRFTPELWI